MRDIAAQRVVAVFAVGLASIAAAVSTASAGVIISSAVVGGTPNPGSILDNLNAATLPLGSAGGTTATGLGISFTGDGAAVVGQTAVHAPPFLSNNQGVAFGDPNGPDASQYLTSGIGSFIVVLPTEATYFGICGDRLTSTTRYNST